MRTQRGEGERDKVVWEGWMGGRYIQRTYKENNKTQTVRGTPGSDCCSFGSGGVPVISKNVSQENQGVLGCGASELLID